MTTHGVAYIYKLQTPSYRACHDLEKRRPMPASRKIGVTCSDVGAEVSKTRR